VGSGTVSGNSLTSAAATSFRMYVKLPINPRWYHSTNALRADGLSWSVGLSVPLEWPKCHFMPGLDRLDGPWIEGDICEVRGRAEVQALYRPLPPLADPVVQPLARGRRTAGSCSWSTRPRSLSPSRTGPRGRARARSPHG
jgi:hypothetical protein